MNTTTGFLTGLFSSMVFFCGIGWARYELRQRRIDRRLQKVIALSAQVERSA